MWAADPRFLKNLIEHFSSSAEQLDMYSDSGKAVFTSFTTKVTEGKGTEFPSPRQKLSYANAGIEILKHPVHTSVATDKLDFQEYLVEDNMHVAINLKDFKAIVGHAETVNATVTARFTRPCKPLQLEYLVEGVQAEFTIMTRGQADDDVPSSRATIPRETPAPITISARPSETQASAPNTMPPPPPRSRSIRPLNGSSAQENLTQKTSADRPLASGLSMEFDSLFVPADDDRQWDEMNEEEPQDILGWDASGTQVRCPVLLRWTRWLMNDSRMLSGHLFETQSLLWGLMSGLKRMMRWAFHPLSVCLRFASTVFSTEHIFPGDDRMEFAGAT